MYSLLFGLIPFASALAEIKFEMGPPIVYRDFFVFGFRVARWYNTDGF